VEEKGVRLGGVLLACDVAAKPFITHRKELPHNPARAKGLEGPRDVYLIDYEVCGESEVEAEFKFHL
jgi:hypothetical protein